LKTVAYPGADGANLNRRQRIRCNIHLQVARGARRARRRGGV